MAPTVSAQSRGSYWFVERSGSDFRGRTAANAVSCLPGVTVAWRHWNQGEQAVRLWPAAATGLAQARLAAYKAAAGCEPVHRENI
jgi:hypothetical protein